MTLLLGLLLAAVAFLLSASIVVFVVGPVMLLHPRRRGKEFYAARELPLFPGDLDLEFEECWIQIADTGRLHGWFIPASSPGRGTILYLHGVGDNKMSGLFLADLFHAHHFHVLMYDSRAHGMSEGKYCTYGYHEKHDVIKAIDWVTQRIPVGKIGVFGTSMGAAIAIQAAAIEPRISAVVSEGCFTNLRTITVDYQKRLLRMPWHFLRNIAMKRSEAIARFDHHKVSPVKALAAVHVPLLFIHGKRDTFIKYHYSEELYRAAQGPKELYLIDAANHNDLHEIGKKEYEEHIMNFFEQWLR